LLHVLAYSDPNAGQREVRGLLDDYAFTALACLDAYEATADLSYFKFAKAITDAMLEKFFDETSGGFFDAERNEESKMLGVLSARRKPFQDSPTPAGNSAAAIAVLRLHSYTNHPDYREKAEQTMEVFAGMAGQYGLFAATYGIAGVHFSQPHTQVIVVGEGEQADRLGKAANSVFALNQSTVRITRNEVVPQNLPPALAETLPNFESQAQSTALALLCTGFSCQPPISDPAQLAESLRHALSPIPIADAS
jgi:hypothetical protein